MGQLRDLRTRIAQRGSVREVVRWGMHVAERRLRLAIAMLGRSTAEDPPSEGREIPRGVRCGISTCRKECSATRSVT